MEFLKSQKVPLTKMVLGSPAYGRSFVCEEGMFSIKNKAKQPLHCWEKANLDYCAIVS